MKKITSVTIEIQVQSDEPDASLDAAERILAIKNAAQHLVDNKLHLHAPPPVAAMIELFNMADINARVSPIQLETIANPHDN